VQALRRAGEADPRSPDYAYAAATILAQRGETQAALDACRDALARNPAYAPALTLMAQLGGMGR
jgi:thioredoxin-like negative regulator of GroEL